MPGHKREYTQEFKTKVCNYYKTHSVRDIRQKFRIAQCTIYQILREAGIETRGYWIKSQALRFGMSDGMSLRERTYDFSRFEAE